MNTLNDEFKQYLNKLNNIVDTFPMDYLYYLNPSKK